jgi:hypothetical protein
MRNTFAISVAIAFVAVALASLVTPLNIPAEWLIVYCLIAAILATLVIHRWPALFLPPVH